MEKLYCKTGEHYWTREPTRGRKPSACPEHRAASVEADKVEREAERSVDVTLRCEAGHNWTRKPARGRKPRWCPEHQPVVAKPKQKREPSHHGLKRAHEAKAEKADERRSAIIKEELDRSRRESCHCDITTDMTLPQLMALGAGCTAGRWVCPTLDTIRRRLGR